MKTAACFSAALKPAFQSGMESCITARSRDCMPQVKVAIDTFPRKAVAPMPRQFWRCISYPFLTISKIRPLTYL